MKRWRVIGSAALVAFGAAGYGVWAWGAQGFARAAEAGLAAAATHGVRVTHGGREIGGFPFAYTVAFRDFVASAEDDAWRLEAPVAVATRRVAAPDRVALALPEAARLTAAGAPPAALTLDGGALPAAAQPGALALSGDRLSLSADDGGRLAADAFALRLSAPAAGALSARLEARRVEASGGGPAPEAARASADDVVLTLEAQGMAGRTLLAALSAGGRLAVEAAAGATARDAPGAAGPTASATGPARLTLSAADGRFEAASTTRDGRFTLRGGASPPEGATLSYAFQEATLAGPFAPALAPEPARLRVAVDGLTGDAAAWAALDPAGGLPRVPASLEIEIAAEVAWRTTLDRAAEHPVAPLGVLSFEIARARVEGLGATLTASGAARLEPEPEGAFDLAASGWRPVLAALERAGVVPFALARQAEAMAAVYAADPADPAALRARIEIDPDGATSNGVPLR